MRTSELLRSKIREVDDFPTAGIKFKDIMPLLEDPRAFRNTIESLVLPFRTRKISKVVGIDARGFLLAPAVAYLLGAGLVAARKKGKLPSKKIIQKHKLEYGESLLEMHVDSIKKGERVLIIDDVLATGGTVEAAIKLVQKLGGKIAGLGFLIEIPLGGRKKLKKYKAKINSLIIYDKVPLRPRF